MNLYTFVKVEYYHPRIDDPLEYGYCLRIRNPFELLLYMMHVDNVEELFNDIIRIRNRTSHGTTWAGYVDLLSQLKGNSAVEEIANTIGIRNDAMAKALSNDKTIYVQSSGGWFCGDDNINELTSEGIVRSDKLVWPKDYDKPRYIQWPNGTHWYVKVGSETVVVDGAEKWSTRRKAENAYKKWREIYERDD